MAFRLGNYSIDEVLYAAYLRDDEIQYTLDQLSSASIEVSAESTDITDKNGNVVRTIYTSKTGTFTATNAFLHCQIMATQGGTDAEFATEEDKIVMPKMVTVDAGQTLDVSDAIEGSIKIIGLYGNGANDPAFTAEQITAAVVDGTFTAPEAGDDKPVSYLVDYKREVSSGAKIVNDAKTFPKTGELLLQCSYIDPCDEDTKILYVLIPSFQPDPNMTISLDRETQELDFNGNLQIDYCSGSTKALYYIYVPEND